jgi:hypothetical protein
MVRQVGLITYISLREGEVKSVLYLDDCPINWCPWITSLGLSLRTEAIAAHRLGTAVHVT